MWEARAWRLAVLVAKLGERARMAKVELAEQLVLAAMAPLLVDLAGK